MPASGKRTPEAGMFCVYTISIPPPWPGCDDCKPVCPGGAVRAHIKCAPTTRRGGRCVCRGGFHIRPGRPAISMAPRRASWGGMPTCRHGRAARFTTLVVPAAWFGGVWALRTGSNVRRRGGLYGRPDRPAVSTASPSNLVGRHAHMPPWPGCDDRRPWWLRRCGSGGC